MAERLNIRVEKNGAVLASAYYHCSGYTCEAASLVRKMLDYYRDSVKEKLEDGSEGYINAAIDMLEETGARLSKDEYTYYESKDFLYPSQRDYFEPRKRQAADDRYKGVIGVTDYEIDQFEDLCCDIDGCLVYVDVGKEKVRFIALEYGIDEDEEIPRNKILADTSKLSLDINDEAIPFDDFPSFADFVRRVRKESKTGYFSLNGVTRRIIE